MKKGEKGILLLIVVIVGILMVVTWVRLQGTSSEEKNIPFYTTASIELQLAGDRIYKQNNCRKCHTLWTLKDIMQTIPAPAMDGIGSLKDEAWLFNYLSSETPQSILPSRLKKEYRMPSYATLPEHERKTLAAYLSSLRVMDWYLDEARKAECKKLTGEVCK